jgi:hypothetical protein
MFAAISVFHHHFVVVIAVTAVIGITAVTAVVAAITADIAACCPDDLARRRKDFNARFCLFNSFVHAQWLLLQFRPVVRAALLISALNEGNSAGKNFSNQNSNNISAASTTTDTTRIPIVAAGSGAGDSQFHFAIDRGGTITDVETGAAVLGTHTVVAKIEDLSSVRDCTTCTIVPWGSTRALESYVLANIGANKQYSWANFAGSGFNLIVKVCAMTTGPPKSARLPRRPPSRFPLRCAPRPAPSVATARCPASVVALSAVR